ncbi:MAG: bifunctional protein PyrR [Isosphaeraceae bacterium]|nr:MAG: bifunctional protein PyrR [Isosphaeraceae bacterium]
MPLRDARELAQLLDDLTGRIAAVHNPQSSLALVGIRTRGVPIAHRLAQGLRDRYGIDSQVGAVDITLYRDDLDRGRRWPVLRGTEIPFPVDDAEVILVDDVIHTGRSARAALNAVCDLGRPSRVWLAVVVDRGGRELPLQPDFAGLVCQAGPAERILVRIQPVDPVEEIIRTSPQNSGPSDGAPTP